MNKILDFIERDLQHERVKRAEKLGITLDQLKTIEDAEKAAFDADQAVRQAAYERDRERRQREADAACKALGERLGLGISVSPAEIVMVRYLTERGMGTGTNKFTVIHARVLEDFASGRIKRQKGDLLCGRKGKFDTHNVAVDQALTCPRCNEIITRHAKRD